MAKFGGDGKQGQCPSGIGLPGDDHSVSTRPMKEVAPLTRRPATVDPSAEYPQLSARSFGRGTFHQPTLYGADITWEKPFQVRAGDILVSNARQQIVVVGVQTGKEVGKQMLFVHGGVEQCKRDGHLDATNRIRNRGSNGVHSMNLGDESSVTDGRTQGIEPCGQFVRAASQIGYEQQVADCTLQRLATDVVHVSGIELRFRVCEVQTELRAGLLACCTLASGRSLVFRRCGGNTSDRVDERGSTAHHPNGRDYTQSAPVCQVTPPPPTSF